VGSRNRATQLAEAILDDNAEAIFAKLVELSLAGRETMLKLAAERIVPRRARTRPFPLPEINSAADLMAAIARAAAEGVITPFDAAEMARLVETALPPRSAISSAASPSSSARSRARAWSKTMHPRLKAFERRLTRLAGIVRSWSEPARRHRDRLHARRVMHELICEGLRRAGIDPAEAVALRRFDEPEPPPPRVRLRPIDAREELIAKMERLAARMRGRPPDLAKASAAMLFAYYCIGEGAREAPA
jgi:hypothetical protein